MGEQFYICDLLWGNWPYRRLFQNVIKACKVDTVITAVGDQIIFFFNPHYFLNIVVKFYSVQALRKW